MKSNVTANYEYICTDCVDNKQREKGKQMYGAPLETQVEDSLEILEWEGQGIERSCEGVRKCATTL